MVCFGIPRAYIKAADHSNTHIVQGQEKYRQCKSERIAILEGRLIGQQLLALEA